ncbi:hypothetical protein GGI07_003888 [Coemansia sp. Benny D115]|nr:hypothetical protein GGI07_003888 [Coemansia sp. Benny D115]
MSVASANPFALLPDNAVDTEINTAAISKKAAQKPAQKAAAPAAAQPERSTRTTKPDYPTRGGRRMVSVRGTDAPAPEERAGQRPRGDGRRHRHVAGPRGREFDRHSATGKTDSEKKIRQGWQGSDKALVKDDAEATAQAKQDADGAATPEVEQEPEEVVKTLEDYLKERESAGVDSERTLRNANEGAVDKNQLKGAVALERVEEDFFAPTASQKSRKQRERKEKVYVDIEQRFADEQRRGAFRGGRTFRGNDRRGGNNSRQNRVNINDQSAFPSL